ncbi:MBL fold metallo-hydrolase [Roseibium sediminicola]|uniref:MBL fold metallo-hydrolase n=1 Tax=Roseibium sediminicola TaxID=2933272 RepID=A0ABT0GZJ8_9HYPH|nr:MBL fold metallo-hydrolase [Roseibium sp. CAU 1639]MCK7614260.1 MBL fold metallo-hydrolase [Roseibium sp. CAU 1639]
MSMMTNGSDRDPGANEQFEEIGQGCYAFSADGCSNTGVVIGERGVLIIDGQATPALAEKVLSRVRALTDKPVKSVVLTHFHADNTLGASAFEPGEVIASDLTRRMVETRGAEDILVSRERDPRLFSDLPSGSTVAMPTMTIASSMTIDLGGLEVRLMHLGRGHTMGDLVVWVPSSGVIFAGDLVQKSAIPYCGDAHLADWPRALDRITAFRPTALVPGRGRVANGTQAVATAIETTRDYVTTLRDAAAACVEQRLGLKDTYLAVKDALSARFASRDDFDFHLPLNVARAYDEALGLDQPQLWTRERIADLQDALEGTAPAVAEAGDDTEVTAQEPTNPAEEAPAETAEAASDTGAADLVSDSDFAASLALGPEDENADDEASLDLASEDIVEDSGEAEPEPEKAEGDGKVLEDAR